MHETYTQGISYSGYLHWAPNVTGVRAMSQLGLETRASGIL